MDLGVAWINVTTNIYKKLMDNSEDIESESELDEEFFSLLKSVTTLIESKDLNAFEKRSKFIELIKQALSLKKRVDEFDDKCLGYNIPSLFQHHQSFKNYLKNLQEFMEKWKEVAKDQRANGGKSLIEKLKEHDHQSQRKSSFDYLNRLLICVGTYLCEVISDFILMIVILGDRKEIMKNLEDFKTMVKLLSLESDNSIVIKNLVSTIQLTKTMVKKKKRLDIFSKSGKVLIDDGDVEFELLRMTLKEILFAQIVFCCPEMKASSIDDRFLLSYGHVLHKYFMKRLNSLHLKMNELRVQSSWVCGRNQEGGKKLKILQEMMAQEIRNMWKRT
ncbi:hypothetical protein CsatB_002045 [Cannabis sativa]